MATAYPIKRSGSFIKGLGVQRRVLGALFLRELHVRYGRENVGYLWLIGEPLSLAGVMALFHHSGGDAVYGSDIKPLPFVVVCYTTYIMFRGIVNRSGGALENNAQLLYHRSVSIFDIVFTRAAIDGAGVFLTYMVLEVFLWSMGWVEWPARWLYLLLAQGLMFWYSLGHAMIIGSISFHNRTVERFVHPYTYFMIPLGASFFQVAVLPEPYRSYLLWLPLPHILELARYGQFNSANLRYCDIGYIVSACVILTWIGLMTMRVYRKKVHLS